MKNHFNPLSVIVYLAVLVALFAPMSHARKPLPPVSTNLEFAESNLTIGSTSELIFTVTADKDVPEAEVVFTLPEQVEHLSGNVTWSGELWKGQPKQFSIYVKVMAEGEYSVFANVSCTGLGFRFGKRSHLNMLAFPSRIVVSTNPFLMMKMHEVEAAKETTVLQQWDAANIAPAKLRELQKIDAYEHELKRILKPKKDKKIKKQRTIQRLTESEQAAKNHTSRHKNLNSSSSVTIRGKAFYKDSSGSKHPIRLADVGLYNAADELLDYSSTNVEGSYSFSISLPVGTVVYVDIDSEIAGIVKIGPVDQPDTIYYMSSANHTVSASGSLVIGDIVTDAVVLRSTTDSTAGRIFSVLDAVLQYHKEGRALIGTDLPMLRVNFPFGANGSADYSYYADSAVNLLRADALDWDVIGHEFGHFLGDRGASSNFDNSPGGCHAGTSTLNSNSTCTGIAKGSGIRLAWSEGWATFFAIAAQQESLASGLGISMPPIPNTGTVTYHDTEDAGISDNLETIGNGSISGDSQGYASEYSIAAALWDLFDNNQDNSSDSEAIDEIDWSHQAIWNHLNSGSHDDVGKFFQRLFAAESNLAKLSKMSNVFAMNNIAPELDEPANDTIVSGGVSPEFTWQANGDPNTSYENNRFLLAIFKGDFESLVMIKAGITDTSYTFSDEDWQNVVAAADVDTTFKWIVLGYNNVPPTGFGFVSNAHSFTVRSYHVKITWSPVGADVDLHLRPPSGASYSGWDYSDDCAYYNRSPDWGVAWDSLDDPSLDRDCISSCTEENITIDKVTTPGIYRAMVHYYNDHGEGPAAVNLKIFRFSQEIYSANKVLNNTGSGPSTGDVWTAFEINIPASGQAQIAPVNKMSKGSGLSGDALRLMELKK